MYQYPQTSFAHSVSRAGKKIAFMVKTSAFLLCFLPGIAAFGQQTNKIQEMITSIKQTYYCDDQDYHTDGQRTIWVKSYKRWEPQDLAIMKKEAPGMFRFLGMVAQRTRYDILEQLLPNYYREHGGVKTFAADIIKEQNPASR